MAILEMVPPASPKLQLVPLSDTPAAPVIKHGGSR